MNEVVRILMERDEVTEEEAKEMIAECRAELNAGNYSAMQDVLELEDDFLLDVLF